MATLENAYLSQEGLAIIPYSIIAGYPRNSSNLIDSRVEFNLTNFSAGAYTIGPFPASPNKLTLIDDSGIVLEGISGSFANVPIVPSCFLFYLTAPSKFCGNKGVRHHSLSWGYENID